MVITRKIEVFICENDKDQRRAYYEKLYANRDIAVKAANMAISHLFVLDNTMPYLSEESKESIEFLGVKGQKATKQNAPYVAASEAFKGQADMGMVSCVLSNVQKMYQSDSKIDPKNGKHGFWDKSLRSYKENMPVPFKADRFVNLRLAEITSPSGNKYEGGFFSLMGIPFQMRFGRDRSGNRLIVERILSGEYKMCTSSIQITQVRERLDLLNEENDKRKQSKETGSVEDGQKKKKKQKQKIFLLLCVDIPKKEVKINPEKKLFAFLGVMNPVICTCDIRAYKVYDSGYKWFEIGTKEEFNYRRRQIQEAVRRCQINNRYTTGGKGRKKKCQAIERWHEKENNYVDTKLHTYSRMLVDLAIKHECGQIILMNQIHREDEAKEDNKNGEPFVLRNWTYYGFKEKIEYKCKMVGITLKVEK